MFETFNHIDQQFFLAINNGLQNPFLDWLCPILRNQKVWYPLYAILIFLLYKKHKKETLWIVLGAAVLILISDQVSANLIKNLVQRLRPCSDPGFQNQVHLLVNCGGGFSFISAHATNHFAIAFFMMGFFETQKRWFVPVAFIWASSIAFSQVYVGVHYPFDVICGAILGSILGYIFSRIIISKLKTNNKPQTIKQ